MIKPLYTHSLNEARRSGQIQQWRESRNENARCAKAIAEAIRANFDGMHLQNDCQRPVIEEFGFNRVNFVLASTLQCLDYDGRFSKANKEWAKGFFIADDVDNRTPYRVTSHPAILDGFVTNVRKQWSELGLFDISQCIADSKLASYEDELLILKPEMLADEYKKPEYQLFLAESGFGCSATARGQSVFGRFLYDGERCSFDRSDFLGIADSHFLPDWAFEKLDALTAQDDGESDGMSMQ